MIGLFRNGSDPKRHITRMLHSDGKWENYKHEKRDGSDVKHQLDML